MKIGKKVERTKVENRIPEKANVHTACCICSIRKTTRKLHDRMYYTKAILKNFLHA